MAKKDLNWPKKETKWPKKRPNGRKRDPFVVDGVDEHATSSRRYPADCEAAYLIKRAATQTSWLGSRTKPRTECLCVPTRIRNSSASVARHRQGIEDENFRACSRHDNSRRS